MLATDRETFIWFQPQTFCVAEGKVKSQAEPLERGLRDCIALALDDHMMLSSLYLQAAKYSKWLQLIIFLYRSKRTKDGRGAPRGHHHSLPLRLEKCRATPAGFKADPGGAKRKKGLSACQALPPARVSAGLQTVSFGGSAAVAHVENHGARALTRRRVKVQSSHLKLDSIHD